MREYELTEKEKKEIISVLKQFLMNKKQAHKNNLMSLFYK